MYIHVVGYAENAEVMRLYARLSGFSLSYSLSISRFYTSFPVYSTTFIYLVEDTECFLRAD